MWGGERGTCSQVEAQEPTKLPLAGWRGRSPLSSQLFSLSHNKTGGGRVGKKLETRVAAIVAGSSPAILGAGEEVGLQGKNSNPWEFWNQPLGAWVVAQMLWVISVQKSTSGTACWLSTECKWLLLLFMLSTVDISFSFDICYHQSVVSWCLSCG